MLEVRYIYNFNNKPVNEYTIKNGKYSLSVINIGATITKMIVPNKNDKLENIILRYYDYKDYKLNPYHLGCLIDTEKFTHLEPCGLNYYFECTFEDNTLIFTYRNNDDYIIVKYSLLNNMILIEYDTNFPINLSHVIFFNLSGNLKESILKHQLEIGSKTIDFKEDISYFRHFLNKDNETLLKLKFKDNGIGFNLDALNRDIYLSFGKYFNKEFFINKKNVARLYSGIGIVACGKKQNQFMSIEFFK
ncbi:hypothetical protein KHQ81_10680 [Mycoplasmatota bacterium]|nr:hypothetical protein KHQ81_10680 [Mycoplasmatota bacterium]